MKTEMDFLDSKSPCSFDEDDDDAERDLGIKSDTEMRAAAGSTLPHTAQLDYSSHSRPVSAEWPLGFISTSSQPPPRVQGVSIRLDRSTRSLEPLFTDDFIDDDPSPHTILTIDQLGPTFGDESDPSTLLLSTMPTIPPGLLDPNCPYPHTQPLQHLLGGPISQAWPSVKIVGAHRVPPFEERVEALRQFLSKYNRMPSYADPFEKPLASWVHRIRHLREKNKLRPDLIQQLEELPGWVWRGKQPPGSSPGDGTSVSGMGVSFERRLQQVRDHVAQRGALPVYSGTADKMERTLATWVHKVRHLKQIGRLPDVVVETLETIPCWKWRARDSHVTSALSRDPLATASTAASTEGLAAADNLSVGVEDVYEIRLVQLERFLRERSKFPGYGVSASEEERSLARWVDRMRNKRKKGKLRMERMRRLEEVPGWKWRVRDEAGSGPNDGAMRFNARLEELRDFIKEFGRFPSYSSYADVKEKALMRWVDRVRMLKKKGKLSQAAIEELDRVPGFRWAVKDQMDGHKLLGHDQGEPGQLMSSDSDLVASLGQEVGHGTYAMPNILLPSARW